MYIYMFSCVHTVTVMHSRSYGCIRLTARRVPSDNSTQASSLVNNHYVALCFVDCLGFPFHHSRVLSFESTPAVCHTCMHFVLSLTGQYPTAAAADRAGVSLQGLMLLLTEEFV